jgi:hypothetical protein
MQCKTVIMKLYPILCKESTIFIGGLILLQKDVDLRKVIPGSYCETHQTSCNDGNEGNNIKVEEVTVIQQEEEPLPIEFSKIKAEQEVSCMYVHC